MQRRVLAAESVTELGDEVRGAVLVAGSHGGLIACYLGASAGAHALILNDAGVGLEGAGIAGLVQLDMIGMAAATVSNLSARIGDGQDSLARGVISHVNRGAANAGVGVGMPAREAAMLLRDAPPAQRGRVMSILQALIGTAYGLGIVVIGGLGDVAGLRVAFFTASILLAALFTLLVRRLPHWHENFDPPQRRRAQVAQVSP